MAANLKKMMNAVSVNKTSAPTGAPAATTGGGGLALFRSAAGGGASKDPSLRMIELITQTFPSMSAAINASTTTPPPELNN